MGLFNKLKSIVTESVKESVKEKISDLVNPDEPKVDKPEGEKVSDASEKKKKEKPEGVPSEAWWNKENKEWELGKENSQGVKIGEWKYWLKKGTLACQTFHEGETGQDFAFVRFHKDGTYSQKGTYKNGVNHGVSHYQDSENETKETAIPPQAPSNVFRMIYEWENGQIISSQLFDVGGNELDQHGNLLKPEQKGDTPKDAVWNAEEQQWEKEESVNGVLNGLSSSWNAMGEKTADTIYDNGVLLDQKIFHPDGTVAYIESYEKGMDFMKYRMHARSDNPTDQEFPQGDFTPNVFKLEYFHDHHGYMTSWKTSDREDNVVQETPVYSNLENRVPNTKFNSFEEASEVWNSNGDKFYKDMNWWLTQYYAETTDVPEGTPEPLDARDGMERVVLEALEQLNKDGQAEKARQLFKPSYEPISKFTWQNIGKNVSKVISLDDKNTLAQVDGKCYLLSGTKISELEQFIAIGSSKDKAFLAKAYADRIEVTKGLDGEVTTTMSYPKQFMSEIHEKFPALVTEAFNSPENMGISEVKLSSDGTKGLLVTEQGTYLLSESNAKQVYPHFEKMEELVSNFEERTGGDLAAYFFAINIKYPNADFSADDKYIVIGGMLPAPVLAGTCIYALNGDEVVLKKYGEPDSMFGIVNEFHPNGEDMIHAACMYGSINTNWSASMENTAFKLGVGQIEMGEVELDNFAGAYMQAPGMVRSVCPLENGFSIGNNQGYLWLYNQEGQLSGHTHVGGTLTSMDISADKKHIVIGTDQGQIMRLKCIEERGKGLITDMNVEDVQRYIFFRSYEPMAW